MPWITNCVRGWDEIFSKEKISEIRPHFHAFTHGMTIALHSMWRAHTHAQCIQLIICFVHKSKTTRKPKYIYQTEIIFPEDATQKKNIPTRVSTNTNFFLLRTNREKKIIVIACVIKININNCMNGADRDREREKHVYYFHCNRNAWSIKLMNL